MRLLVWLCNGFFISLLLIESDSDLKVAKISLGTLGAISKITFTLQHMFKRSFSTTVKDDNDLENEAESFLRVSEYAYGHATKLSDKLELSNLLPAQRRVSEKGVKKLIMEQLQPVAPCLGTWKTNFYIILFCNIIRAFSYRNFFTKSVHEDEAPSYDYAWQVGCSTILWFWVYLVAAPKSLQTSFVSPSPLFSETPDKVWFAYLLPDIKILSRNTMPSWQIYK